MRQIYWGKKNNSFSNYSNQNSGRVQLRITEFNTVHISNQSVNDLSSRFSPWGRQMVTVSIPEQRWEQDLGVSQQGRRGQLRGVRARVRLTFNTGAGVRCCVRAPVGRVGQTLMMSAVTSWSRLSRDQEPLSHGFSRWPTLQGPGSGTQQWFRATLCACVC